MTDSDAYDTILLVCAEHDCAPREILGRRVTKALYPVKGEAVARLRAEGRTWPNIARVMLYAHHSQAMAALNKYNATKIQPLSSVLPSSGCAS